MPQPSSRIAALGPQLLLVAAVVGALRGAADAQTCDEIRSMSWQQAQPHIYVVHAINQPSAEDNLTWTDMLGNRGVDRRIVIGSHIKTGVTIGQKLLLNEPERVSLHFTWNHLVQWHAWGSWEDAKIILIEPIARIAPDLVGSLPVDNIVVGPHTIDDNATMLVERSVANDPAVVRAMKGRPSQIFDGRPRVPVTAALAQLHATWEVYEESTAGDTKGQLFPLRSRPQSIHPSEADYDQLHPLPLWLKTPQCTEGVKLFPVGVESPRFMQELVRDTFVGQHAAMPLIALEKDQGTALWRRLRACWTDGECEGKFRRHEHSPDPHGMFVCEAYRVHSFLWRYGARSTTATGVANDVLLYAVAIDLHGLLPAGQRTPALWRRIWRGLLERRLQLLPAISDLCDQNHRGNYRLALETLARVFSPDSSNTSNGSNSNTSDSSRSSRSTNDGDGDGDVDMTTTNSDD